MKKTQSPHPLLDTTPRPPDAKKKLMNPLDPRKPPATFDDFLPTSTSSDALVHPDRVASNPPAPDQSQPQPGRFFGRFGKSAADLKQLEIVRKSKKQQQQESCQRAKDHRRAKKEALHEERARNQWLGGLAWGFDPEAGQNIKADICARPESENRDRSERKQIAGRHKDGEELLKTDATSRMWLEAGGPGNEGHFGYGLLKTRDADVLNSARRGGLKLKATRTSSDSGKGTGRSSSQASARMSRTQSSSGQRPSIPQVHISKPLSPTPQGSRPSIPPRSQSSQ